MRWHWHISWGKKICIMGRHGVRHIKRYEVVRMKCPRTKTPLKAVKVGGVEIDLSEGCGGVWLDNFELEKFSSPSSLAGEVLVEHLKKYHRPLPNAHERLKCPKDTDVVMMRRYYSSKMQIEIDECPACGGIWLDAEELEGIRKLFSSQAEFEESKNKFIEEVMTGDVAKMHNDEHDRFIKKMEKVSRVLWSMTVSLK